MRVPTQLVRDVCPGSRIIYTPMYESWLQPIELEWNQTKQRVAHGARKERKLDKKEAATKNALLRSELTPAPPPSRLCPASSTADC